MSDPVRLKGMTWSHPRGYDPMIACTRIWAEKTGIAIDWDKRSLQDFEAFPVEELARQYDLIVIDHPHVGQITAEACLAPLDVPGHEAERAAIAQGAVGRSYESYTYKGRQWAFPIDAATQVQATRPDLLSAPPKSWDDVTRVAGKGHVMLPLMPPHSLMCFYSLAANLGSACATEAPGDLVDRQTGLRVLDMLAELSACIDPACFDMDPIAVLEAMAETGSKATCVPLIYGYVSYAHEGFRPARIAFSDIPAAGGRGPVGTTLGGTGIAVSARSVHPGEAIAFAHWIASGEVQAGPFADAGGQPGHAMAWESETVNAATQDFYRNTRATLEGAWVRPRYNGYMAFQKAGSERLTEGLRAGDAAAAILEDLEVLYRQSFASAKRD